MEKTIGETIKFIRTSKNIRGIANISEILYVKERLKYARFYATS